MNQPTDRLTDRDNDNRTNVMQRILNEKKKGPHVEHLKLLLTNPCVSCKWLVCLVKEISPSHALNTTHKLHERRHKKKTPEY